MEAERKHWAQDTNGADLDACGSSWPVVVNLTNFVQHVLPQIVLTIPAKTRSEPVRMAIVTHSTTMYRTLQPLQVSNDTLAAWRGVS